MISKLAQNVARRYLHLKIAGPVDPRIAQAAMSMVGELKDAEQSLSRALQFSRIIAIIPAVEWVPEQLESTSTDFKGLSKAIQESVDYLSTQVVKSD